MPVAAPAYGSTAATARRPSWARAALPGSVIEQTVLQSNVAFKNAYTGAGGHNATFNIDSSGMHSWNYWNAQLVAMKPDMQRTLGAGGGPRG